MDYLGNFETIRQELHCNILCYELREMIFGGQLHICYVVLMIPLLLNIFLNFLLNVVGKLNITADLSTTLLRMSGVV
ncbi:hypothetical protein DMT30_13175 [Klebsiella variicola]|nr:hypothetical protein DMT30_13175 [Klebsiella variicola]